MLTNLFLLDNTWAAGSRSSHTRAASAGGAHSRASLPCARNKVLGAEELAGKARSKGFADLVDELRKCQALVANPQHRYQFP
jgi:hypothetical protein